MYNEVSWRKWLRIFGTFGLLTYLASFYFLGRSAQKTIFYLLVAAPGLFLLPDLRLLIGGKSSSLVLSTLAFLAYFMLSSLWSTSGSVVTGMKLALCVVCLMVIIHSTMEMLKGRTHYLLNVILFVGACATCFYSVILIAKILGPSEQFAGWLTRLSMKQLSGVGDSNPINTAIYLGVATLASWWTVPYVNRLSKILLFFVAATSTVLLFMTQSRGPFISLIIVLFLISITRRHKDDLLLCGIGVASAIISFFYFDLAAVITNRAIAPSYRVEIWSSALSLISDNLFFGQGLGRSADISFVTPDDVRVTVSHSHSSIIETFRVGGLLGGLLFFPMVFFSLKGLSRELNERWFFLFWLLFGVLCLMTNGRFFLIRPSVEWFAFWIPLFLVTFTPSRSG